MSQIASTYKAPEVEETLDRFFYRPLGYYTAKVCAGLGITPNAVTIASVVIGVAGSHLLYYRNVATNAWGLVLWVVADILDSADGQLARMTNNKSKIGRILDGVAGNFIFLSIYLHLIARMVGTYPGIGWPLFFLFALVAGISHSMQSALADYYRNAYLKFVVDPTKSELEGSDAVRKEYGAIRFSEQPVKKILMRTYLNYTVQQESLSKNFQRLRKTVDERFGTQIPPWFATEYRTLNKPLIKYYAILTTNTRMFIMGVFVLLDRVPFYFATEIILLNLLMVVVTVHQEGLSRRLLAMIEKEHAS